MHWYCMLNTAAAFNFTLLYYYYTECGKCIIHSLLILFPEYLLKRANTAAMEHIYEEILSPCKRLKVSSNVLPDGLHHPNLPLKGYHAPPPSVMSSEDQKTRPLKVLQNEGQYISTILLYKEKII